LHKGRDKLKLIGVVYAGFEYDVEGKIYKSNSVDQFLNISDRLNELKIVFCN